MSANISEAGRRGSSVRSDIWIRLEVREKGGIEFDFSSKVEVLYGASTRQLLKDGLRHFGIEHAELIVEDQGALPFVIMARLEAAVCRAMPISEHKDWLPQPCSEISASDPRSPRRSRLYLPGNEPKYMINAPLHSPDGIILDLEDSVAQSEKDAARVLVRNALISLDFGDCERIVRINQGARGLDDLESIIPHGVQLVLVPKVEDSETVNGVVKKIDEIKKKSNLNSPVWLMPIIESAKGAWFAYDIASAHETVVALAVGLEDYTADIGVERTNEGKESFWARSQVVNAARAAGVQPIDTVFSDLADMVALEASVIEAKSLGFEGKGCIHPRQIDVVHRGFAPTDNEIERAMKITLAFEKAEKEGSGVVSLGRKMIDPPVVKRATRVIRQAEEEGLISSDWRNN
ncbi:MAG: aldolase/citrate lyase family protein [Candidatus Electryonea clarkiae]|nr:aldolase/citrate lyase family protein [Candidatus Electryonea clarkiae]MDP8286092.1 aldolase/citrate lyase family protein [Candidatus Electryonea clarkiae]